MSVAIPEQKMEQSVKKNGRILSIYNLVLAAGSADRFGAPKQLAEFRGQSLLRRVLRLSGRVTGTETVLVVGAQWLWVVEECRTLNPFIVRNEQYESGMASSIATGIRAIQPVADAVLILLADQPLITAEHLKSLQKQWHAAPASIVATEFADVVGPPVIFPADYFDALLSLRGDRGARSVIEDNCEKVIKIPFADAAIDVDTPEDLRRI